MNPHLIASEAAKLWTSVAPLKIHPDLHIWHPLLPNQSDISGVFNEVIVSLRTAFNRLGADVPIVKSVYPLNERPLVLAGHLFDNIQKIVRRPPLEIPRDAIVYNHEQLYEGAWLFPERYFNLLRASEVWDYSYKNIDGFRDIGIKAKLVPVGYVPDLENYRPSQNQDIDVLFVGGDSDRRKAILNNIRSQGLNVVHAKGVYGAARDALCSRAKIVLNLHQFPAAIFESVRVSYLLANGSFVISEDGLDKSLEQDYRGGVVFGSAEQLPDLCRMYVDNPSARALTAAAGQKLIRSMKFENFIENALRQPECRAIVSR